MRQQNRFINIITISIVLLFSFMIALPAPALWAKVKNQDQTKSQAAKKDNEYPEIYRLYGEKKYDQALETVAKILKKSGRIPSLIQLKFNLLMQLRLFDRAMAFIQEEIRTQGETEELLAAQSSVLIHQGKIKEAMDIALKKDKMNKTTAPWDAMNIMNLYLQLGNKDEALNWLQEAVSRGFISYRLLAGKQYALLQNEDRFYDIIENIKFSIGLGLKAKNLRVKLINGEDFSLANQTGKVILVQFWATWCLPCKDELPRLKEYYQKYKNQGFDILAVSLDSNFQKLTEYLDANPLPWKHCFSGKVWQDPAVKHYGINNIPSYWLVDKRGILRSVDLMGEELDKAIGQLLAEK